MENVNIMPVNLTAQQEEISKALHTIQDICKANSLCKTCPLYSENKDDCLVVTATTPEDWVITSQYIWRALI